LTDPLGALGLRLDRATDHLEALRDEIRTVEKANTYSIFGDKDPQSGWKIIRLKVIEEPPPRLGLLAGELCYQLRAALDNLVAALVLASGGTVTRHHQFPIISSPDDYPAERKRRLVGLRPEWIAIIDGLQPHLTEEPLRPRHPLAGLAALSNFDKHRAIPPVFMMSGAHEINVRADQPSREPHGRSVGS
jgi:hypothetical protein